MRCNDPAAYLITFSCYGTRVHGDERGSVHHDQPWHGWPTVAPDPEVERVMRGRMKHPMFELNSKQRGVVHRTIIEVCAHRQWPLLAQNVRTNHVHVVVNAACNPEKVLGDLKAWCTRRMREQAEVPKDRRVWTDGGSTRYLWSRTEVAKAIEYVTVGQGPDLPME